MPLTERRMPAHVVHVCASVRCLLLKISPNVLPNPRWVRLGSGIRSASGRKCIVSTFGKRKTAPSPNIARTRTLSIRYLEVTASCMPPKLNRTARRVSHPSTAPHPPWIQNSMWSRVRYTLSPHSSQFNPDPKSVPDIVSNEAARFVGLACFQRGGPIGRSCPRSRSCFRSARQSPCHRLPCPG